MKLTVHAPEESFPYTNAIFYKKRVIQCYQLSCKRKLATAKTGQFTFSTQLMTQNYPVILSHPKSTTVSLETYPLYSFDEKAYKKMFLFICLKEVQAQFSGEQFLKSHVFEIRSLKRPSKANLI